MLVDVAGSPAFGQLTTGSSALTGANGMATPSTTVSAASAARNQPERTFQRVGRPGPSGSEGPSATRAGVSSTTAMVGNGSDAAVSLRWGARPGWGRRGPGSYPRWA